MEKIRHTRPEIIEGDDNTDQRNPKPGERWEIDVPELPTYQPEIDRNAPRPLYEERPTSRGIIDDEPRKEPGEHDVHIIDPNADEEEAE